MKAIRLASIVDQLLLSLESDMTADLTPQMIQALVNEWLHNELARWEDHRLERILERGAFPLDQEPRNYESLIQVFEKDVQQAKFSQVTGTAQGMIEDKGLEVDRSSRAYKRLCLELLRARVRWVRIEQKRSRGEDYSHDLPQGGSGPLVGAASGKDTPSYVTLSEAVEKYITVKTDDPETWAPGSKVEIPPHLREFVELVEYHHGKGFLIGSLNRDVMRDYKSTLSKLPARRTILKEFRDKTILQLLKMGGKGFAPKTLKNKHTIVRSFLKWAEDEGYVSNSGPLRRAIPDPKQEVKAGQSTRNPFDSDDLCKLFHSPDYSEDKHTQAARYWVPLMGLYSGARLEEMCQLEVEDFRQDEGIWVFDINAKGDKHVKSDAGKRIVPVHPALLELGLIDRVEAMKAQGHERLFPGLKRNQKGNLSDGVSKWFTRYRRDQGIPDEENKVFHSFRHTFATEVKLRQLDRRMLKELIGHEAGLTDDVTDIYQGKYPVGTLFNEVMVKVSFDLDLEKMGTTNWIEKV